MVVVVLTAVPPGLRGHLTRWLLEIAPGVFVGYPSARVRAHLWSRVIEFSDTGRALMVFSTRGEQRLGFRVHEHDWTPEDHDGIQLIRRPIIVREREPITVPETARPTRKAAETPSSATVKRRRQKRMKFRPKARDAPPPEGS